MDEHGLAEFKHAVRAAYANAQRGYKDGAVEFMVRGDGETVEAWVKRGAGRVPVTADKDPKELGFAVQQYLVNLRAEDEA